MPAPDGEAVCPENDFRWCELYIYIDLIAHTLLKAMAATLIPGTKKSEVAAKHALKNNGTFIVCFKMLVRKGVIDLPFAYCQFSRCFSTYIGLLFSEARYFFPTFPGRWHQRCTLVSEHSNQTRNDLCVALTTPPHVQIGN